MVYHQLVVVIAINEMCFCRVKPFFERSHSDWLDQLYFSCLYQGTGRVWSSMQYEEYLLLLLW